MDAWMVPLPDDFINGLSIKQPLLFINSFEWQWKENVQKMFKLTQSSGNTDGTAEKGSVVTIKYV